MIEIDLSAYRVFTDLKYVFFFDRPDQHFTLIYISHQQDQQTIKFLSTNLSGDISLGKNAHTSMQWKAIQNVVTLCL